MYQIWVVVGIIVFAGLFGGWAAYLSDYTRSTAPDNSPRNYELKRYLVLGVVAAAVVPLFLSVLQSALVTSIFTPKKIENVEIAPFAELLIFSGFCLIAAVSARAFLDTVSKQVMRDAGAAKEQARVAQEAAREATEEAAAASELMREVVESKVPNEARNSKVSDELPPDVPVPSVSPRESAALRALTRMSTRTATGVAEDIGMSRNRIGELLDELAFKEAIERTTSQKTGGIRWRITPLGIRILDKMDQNARGSTGVAK